MGEPLPVKAKLGIAEVCLQAPELRVEVVVDGLAVCADAVLRCLVLRLKYRFVPSIEKPSDIVA